MLKTVCLLLLLVTAGCGQRENAKAAYQADQAIQAVKKIVTSPMQDMEAAIQDILALCNSARLSLDPVIRELAAGEAIVVPTTVEDALASSHEFAIQCAMQSGKAMAEHARNNMVRSAATGMLAGAGGLLALLGGGGSVAAIALAMLGKIKNLKSAVQDSVAFAKEAVAIDPKDDVALEELKTKHAAKQVANGTHDAINVALIKVKGTQA